MTYYTPRGNYVLVQELFILFVTLTTSEASGIYITKNRFLGHVPAFLLMYKCLCVGDRNNTIMEPLWYSSIDIKMVYLHYARFLSAFCMCETVLQWYVSLIESFAEEARVKDPTQCIEALCVLFLLTFCGLKFIRMGFKFLLLP